MSQLNSLLRLNLSDLVSGEARVMGFRAWEVNALQGQGFRQAGIQVGILLGRKGGHPIACKQGHGGSLSAALGCWLLALSL
jgi:hypothetical protein